jgi:hypothetical protein
MKDAAEALRQVDNSEPPNSNATVTPYELLKNPFQHKENVVTLNVQSLVSLVSNPNPHSSSEDVTSYAEIHEYFFVLNRMLQDDFKLRKWDDPANLALYDVKAARELSGSAKTCSFDSDNNVMSCIPSDLELLGQIAVIISHDKELHVYHNQNWIVEPMGTIDGTNGLGAPMSLPIVKFWRYVPLPVLDSGCRKGTPANPNPNCG